MLKRQAVTKYISDKYCTFEHEVFVTFAAFKRFCKIDHFLSIITFEFDMCNGRYKADDSLCEHSCP